MKVYILRAFKSYKDDQEETNIDTIECVASTMEDCLSEFAKIRKMIKTHMGDGMIITDETLSTLNYVGRDRKMDVSISWNIETHDLLQEGEGA